MDIVSLIFVLIFVGVALLLVNKVVPMVEWMKTVINAIVIVLVLLYLAHAFGLTGYHVRIR